MPARSHAAFPVRRLLLAVSNSSFIPRIGWGRESIFSRLCSFSLVVRTRRKQKAPPLALFARSPIRPATSVATRARHHVVLQRWQILHRKILHALMNYVILIHHLATLLRPLSRVL